MVSQQERERKAHSLFKRFEGNPVLTAADWPYPANAVFNPAAAQLGDETLLLARVEDMRGSSHLTVARSPNGYTDWQIDPEPALTADPQSHEERWGVEDARIVWLEEHKEFAVTYVSFSEGGPLVSLAITKNFKTFARLGAMLPPEDKDACLFPRRFEGRFALLHRPIVRGEAHIWLSLSPDLKHWGDHQLLIHTRPAYWDTHRVGLACQPIETPEGWLIFYHGVRATTAGQIYRLGLALADLNQPWKLLHRSAEWVLGPQAYYERVGDVGDVVFPTGATVYRKQDELRLYYGAADSTIAVATAKLSEILDFILASPVAHH
jgi:beta-1,4-mannooligosaccharide/beta-1,4-mannosyl-N-acetylglucosamine phosphorylase